MEKRFCCILAVLHVLIASAAGNDLQAKQTDSFYTCSGRVVTDQGIGIQSASVILYENSFNPNTLEVKRRIVQQTNSMEDGTFKIQIPISSADRTNMYTIIAAAQGYSLGWKNWDETSNVNVEIPIGKYGTISGSIIDNAQKPIQDAEIRLLLVSRDNEESPFSDVFDWITATSKEDGSFEFSHIPLNAKAEFVVKAKGRATYCTLLDNPNDAPQFSVNQKNIVITIPKESTIVGHCVNRENKKPVSGVKVALQFIEGLPFVPDLHQITTSDENGAFQFKSLYEGEYYLYLGPNQKETAEWAAIPIEVKLASEETKELDFSVTKGGIYAVKVTDAKSSLPLQDANISIIKYTDSAYVGYSGVTAQNGISRIRVCPNKYDLLQVHREGYRTLELDQLKEINLGDTQQIDIRLHELPCIKGTVFDDNNKKADGVEVSIYLTEDKAVSNDAGQYAIPYESDIEEVKNSYIIGMDDRRRMMGISQIADVNEVCDLHLSNSIAVSGTIVDPNDAYVPNASVSIYLVNDDDLLYLGSYSSAGNGQFTSPHILPNQKYQLSVSSDKYTTKIQEIQIGQVLTDHYNIDPIKLGVVEVQGYVVDESKRPLEGVQVDIYNTYKNKGSFLGLDIQLAGSGFSNSEGKYQVEIRLPESNVDSHFAILHKDNYALKVAQYQSNINEFDQVSLTNKYTHYSGYVIDTNGNPIAGASVYAFVDDLGWVVVDVTYETALTRWLNTKTDNNGYFEFTNTPTNTKSEFGAIADGYVNSFTWPTEKQIDPSIPAGKDNIEIVMQKPGQIIGRLIDKNTLQPIPSETVYLFRLTPSRESPFMSFNASTGEVVLPYTLQNDAIELMTDNEGKFIAVNLTPGDYGLSTYSYIYPTRTWSSIKQIVSISEGSFSQATLEAVKTGKARIQVTNKGDMAPMEGVSVRIKPRKLDEPFIQNPAEFKTDSTGIVDLSLSPGEYAIDALIKEDYVSSDDGKSFVVESNKTNKIQAQMEHSPGFWGVCVDSSDSPVSGADIYIAGSDIPIAVTDAEGLFSISPEIIGQVQEIMIITAYQANRNLAGVLFKDASWTENLLKIQMKPSKKIIGKLVTANGSPIVNGKVELHLNNIPGISMMPEALKNSKMASTETDETGKFYFGLLPDSYNYTLQAYIEGHEKIHISLDNLIFNQGINDLGEIALRTSSLSVSGYLVDQLGYPIQGIEISVYDDQESNQKPVETDSAGRFELDNLTEGKIRLKANYKWDLYEYGTFEAGTTGNRFVLENKYENGRWIYPRDKKPLEGATVEVTLMDAETGESVSGKGASLQIIGDNISDPFIDPDSSGKVTFCVDAGHYVLEGEKFPDYPSASIEVDVEAGKKYEYSLFFNEKPKLTGIITDSKGNAVDNVEFKIYPLEYYDIEDSEVLGDGTYELSWDASKYKEGRDPYLFVENADIQCGRFYKIDSSQRQLDIILEPTSYLVFEDADKLMVDVTFYDKNWENYSYLNTYLDIKKVKKNGLLRITGIYPIPEEMQYHISIFENKEAKEAFIDSEQINPGKEIEINLLEKSK